MDFAVTQLAGSFAQLVEELKSLALFCVNVGMEDLTPGLESAEARPIKMCAFRRGLLPQIRYGGEQPLERRVKVVCGGLTQDRHLGSSAS